MLNYIKYWMVAFFMLLFFLWWYFFTAKADLVGDLFDYSRTQDDTIINLGDNPTQVWNNVLNWDTEVEWNWKKVETSQSASIIVKVTKLLLVLIIALSVTMILYNGMVYIIQTWQWKEWKSLIKNVLLIVVWILVALFSVVIINLIQSIPTTIDKELIEEVDNKTDNSLLK